MSFISIVLVKIDDVKQTGENNADRNVNDENETEQNY